MDHLDDKTIAHLLADDSAKHNLRTLATLHLVCAIRRRPSGIECSVTSDREPASVAALEGFDVLIPGEV